MPGKNDEQLKAKSKKRTRIVASETDSNDEHDSPTMKTCRTLRNSKHNGSNGELPAAGSSQSDSCIHARSVEGDEKSELQIISKITSNDSINEASSTQPIVNKLDLVVPSTKDTVDPVITANLATDTDVKKNNDEEHDICPICWGIFENQEVGEPMLCQHSFCLQCLIEWSKNKNTCPLDGRAFSYIVVRNKLGGTRTRCIPTESRNTLVDDWIDNDGFEYIADSNSEDMEFHDYSTEEDELPNHILSCPASASDADLAELPALDMDDGESLAFSNSNDREPWDSDQEQMYFSSSEDCQDDHFSSDHDDNERGSSANHDNEEANFCSNDDDEERQSSPFYNDAEERPSSPCSNDDEERQSSLFDNNDEERQSSPFYNDDEESQSSSFHADEVSLSRSLESDGLYSPVWYSDASPCSYNDDPAVAVSSNSSSISSLSELPDHSSSACSYTNSPPLPEYSSSDHNSSYSASSADDSSLASCTS